MRLISVLLVCSLFPAVPALADQTNPPVVKDARRFDEASLTVRGPLERYLAQEEFDGPGADTDYQASLDARIAELEREMSEIHTRTPLAFMIAGIVLTGSAGLTAFAGVLAGHHRTLYITAGSLAAVGLPTLVTSATIHGLRKAERRRIHLEIERLEGERIAAPRPFDVQLGFGERTMLTLSWQF